MLFQILMTRALIISRLCAFEGLCSKRTKNTDCRFKSCVAVKSFLFSRYHGVVLLQQMLFNDFLSGAGQQFLFLKHSPSGG